MPTHSSQPALKHQRTDRGQGLVEFALVLPILLVLMLGILDFGRLFFIFSEVSSAVREAIRFSAVNPYDCQLIQQRAGSTLTLTDVNTLDLTIAFDDGEAVKWTYPPDCSEEPPEGLVVTGDRITIRASTQVNLITAGIIGPIVQQTFGPLRVEYVSSRTIVPEDGIETGPTSTPRPTRTPPPGASFTPTATSTHTPTNTPMPPAPPFPFDASVQCNSKRVDFTWGGTHDASVYRLYQADNPLPIQQTKSTSCNNCDSLGTSETRTYYVVAVNAGGESTPSNTDTVTCGAGATDTPTPTRTPTPTATDTSTPTYTPTPSDTPTPSGTPRPTRTGTPTPTACPPEVCTPTPTGTSTLTPTPTSLPALSIAFEPGYPARKTSGPGKQFWVKVRVTNPVGYPVTDASVTLVEPASYAGSVLTHLGNGVYGLSGKCFSGSTSNNTYVYVRAERFSYSPAEVGDWTDNHPASNHCP
jgi:hypothetical protein